MLCGRGRPHHTCLRIVYSFVCSADFPAPPAEISCLSHARVVSLRKCLLLRLAVLVLLAWRDQFWRQS
jgi:hypothetical protein